MKHSLRKLQTDYIDLLYVHWWDFTTSIPELMNSLNGLVASGKVLYLGISDTPAWLVVKCNDCKQYPRLYDNARSNRLTLSQTPASTASPNSASTKATGAPPSATSSATSCPCARQRAWAWRPGGL